MCNETTRHYIKSPIEGSRLRSFCKKLSYKCNFVDILKAKNALRRCYFPFFSRENKYCQTVLLSLLQAVTLLGMWLIPTLLSMKNFWWRFVVVWAIFPIITGFMMKRAMEKPVSVSTPRYVVNLLLVHWHFWKLFSYPSDSTIPRRYEFG